jgi:hypothetical protein
MIIPFYFKVWKIVEEKQLTSLISAINASKIVF